MGIPNNESNKSIVSSNDEGKRKKKRMFGVMIGAIAIVILLLLLAFNPFLTRSPIPDDDGGTSMTTPTVRFISPDNYTLLSGSAVLVTGEVVNDEPVSIKVNGVNATITTPGNFSAHLSIALGSNFINATAVDADGHTGTASMILYSYYGTNTNIPIAMPEDDVPPSSPIVDPIESPVDHPMIDVTGSVDFGTVWVDVLGGVAPVNCVVDVLNQTFTATIKLNPNENVLYFTARDAKGLISEPSEANVSYELSTTLDPKPVTGNVLKPDAWPSPQSTQTNPWAREGVVFGDYLYSITPSNWWSKPLGTTAPPVLRIVYAGPAEPMGVLSETSLNDTYGAGAATFICLGRPFVENGTLYISKYVNGQEAMEVYDVSDPSAPQPLFKGYIQTGIHSEHSYTRFLGVHVTNKIVFAPQGDGHGVRLLDFSNPASPKILSTFLTTSYPGVFPWSTREATTCAVDVVGSIAYISTEFGLITVNVTDPENPVELGHSEFISGTSKTLGDQTHLKVDGWYAYMLGGPSGPNYLVDPVEMHIFDVSDPTAPIIISSSAIEFGYPKMGSVTTAKAVSIDSGDKVGDTVLLGGKFGNDGYGIVATLVAVDVSSPYLPIVSTYLAIPAAGNRDYLDEGYAVSCAADGSTAFVTGVQSVYRVEVEDGRIAFQGNLFVPHKGGVTSTSMASVGDTLVVAREEYKDTYQELLRSYDITDPLSPSLISELVPYFDTGYEERQPIRIVADGDMVYLFSRGWHPGSYYTYESWWLTVIDYADPTNPNIIFDGHLSDLDGDWVRDPLHWMEVGVEVKGGKAYLPISGGLAIIDVSVPSSPSFISKLSVSGSKMGYDVKLLGDTAVLLTENKAVMIDVSDPSNPIEQGTWTYDSPTAQLLKLELVDHLAFIGFLQTKTDPTYTHYVHGTGVEMYASKLVALDLANPASPSIIASMDQVQLKDFKVEDVGFGVKKILLIAPPSVDQPKGSYLTVVNMDAADAFTVDKAFTDLTQITLETDTCLFVLKDASVAFIDTGCENIKIVPLAAPKIKLKSISPNGAPPGTIILIAGSGFSAEAKSNVVTFSNSTRSISIEAVNATKRSLEVIVPCLLAGNYTVTVSTPSGNSEGIRFEVKPIVLEESNRGDITLGALDSLSAILDESASSAGASDPRYEFFVAYREFFEEVAAEVPSKDSGYLLAWDALFHSVGLSDVLALETTQGSPTGQDNSIHQATAPSKALGFAAPMTYRQHCDLAKRMDKWLTALEVFNKLDQIKGSFELAEGMTGFGTAVMVSEGTIVEAMLSFETAGAAALIWGLVKAISLFLEAYLKDQQGEHTMFLEQVQVQPEGTILLYLPEELPDLPSAKELTVTTKWTNDPKVFGLPLAELIGIANNIKDPLEAAGIEAKLPDLPLPDSMTQYQKRTDVVNPEPSDRSLTSSFESVVTVLSNSPMRIQAKGEGSAAVKLSLQTYECPQGMMSESVASKVESQAYKSELPVWVKEPGPTVKIYEPTSSYFVLGQTITVIADATDGGRGGALNLQSIKCTMVGAINYVEEKAFNPTVDSGRMVAKSQTAPPDLRDPRNAWIVVIAEATNQNGKKAVASKLLKCPYGTLSMRNPVEANGVFVSVPDDPLIMSFWIKQKTTSGLTVDPTTIKVNFGDAPLKMFGHGDVELYTTDLLDGIPMNAAPSPGDYYNIANRDLFRNGTPTIKMLGTVSADGFLWYDFTVTFDAPWKDASSQISPRVMMWYWQTYVISIKDMAGNYCNFYPDPFYLITSHAIPHVW